MKNLADPNCDSLRIGADCLLNKVCSIVGTRICIDFIGPDVPTTMHTQNVVLPMRSCRLDSNSSPLTVSQNPWSNVSVLDLEYAHISAPPPPFSIGDDRIACNVWKQFSTTCENSSTQNSEFSFYRSLYHEWIKESSGAGAEMPDLVFAPNAGLEAFPSWIQTLEILSQPNAPLTMFTDYCEDAIVRPFMLMKSWGAPVHHAFINPFRKPVPQPSPSNLLPAFSNGFGFLMGGKQALENS